MDVRRPCAQRDCLAYVQSPASYCPPHLAKRQQRPSTAARGYNAEWRRLSEETRRAWVLERGPWCPGWERDGHWVRESDLCLDHDVGVLCRQCNGRKGGGYDRRSPGPKGGARDIPQW